LHPLSAGLILVLAHSFIFNKFLHLKRKLIEEHSATGNLLRCEESADLIQKIPFQADGFLLISLLLIE